jgi:transcriptional regulator with GAF, ATPase, and Fis domain
MNVERTGHPGKENNSFPYRPTRYMTTIAQEVQQISEEHWGAQRKVTVVGLSPQLTDVLNLVQRVASFDEPVLITGESGSGKESLAQAIYLMSNRRGKPFVSVNCPQYHEGNLTASEFFGHRRGSFTGAVADRAGSFETADGGTVFLDEVGDLPMSTQVMLLRALATGEFFPVGSTKPKSANVRIIAATNRDLREMRGDKQFREDLFFRLSFFRIEVPPLRERQDDWALLAEYCLRRLCHRYGVTKSFSSESMRFLGKHSWPGNVRELSSIVTMGYAMSDGQLIEPHHFISQMEGHSEQVDKLERELWQRIMEDGQDFWTTFHKAFMDRDLNRSQVRAIIRTGLTSSQGNFRNLLDLFRLPGGDYQKFMDFLRHHRLKP